MDTADPAPASDAETSFRAMSIARFIPRFAKPQLLTTNIPTYRQSFSHPKLEGHETSSSPSAASHDRLDETRTQSEAESKQPHRQELGSASYVEWSKLLPVPSNLLGSFQDLFETQRSKNGNQGSTAASQQNGGTVQSAPSASPPPRLVFFGEQHHQPLVMRAQLQTLHALHQQCQSASNPPTARSESAPVYRLHLVLEHFSVLDQHMLNSFSHGRLDPDQLADEYRLHSQEAFQIGHYMPLLMLAKELHVPIWGGFPPRTWARQVFRDGVDSVKVDEQRRADDVSEQTAPSATLPRSPLFTSWSVVTKIGAAHRSYLSGLMRPDLPPRFPLLPSTSSASLGAREPKRDQGTGALPMYPTWLLKPHNIETKGFGPAQALKDSYLAHVTAWILRGANQDDSGPADSGKQSTEPQKGADKDDTSRRVINIALVVCGLGHCEYGFGAPERVVQLLSEQSAVADETATLLPYIIASKPLDSGIWLGYEHPSQPSAPSGLDSAQQGSEQKQSESLEPTSTGSHAVERWLNDPWGRKMADAVLLYEWIDDESSQDADTNADGHQPTSSPSS
ncbi:conserved hypothetical protein [Sporisorium reilianum SRZ2]|uniref:Haem-binding uptake Tiki superfamily ChaN domain-containing protein n=1 Tax=Sporisorium reilianum (strain SRZ2) TaxID=999809 RepID=E6ZRU3_SPORE|nr:conserved hypothetical protein [Sporisorium reilianum SRZ2]